MGNLQKMMARDFPYLDINQSKWFQDLTEEACQNSERSGNRIYIYFDSRENAERCVAKCEKRNISNVGILEDTFYKTFRVDILMNWKERRPSRLKIRKEQFLD